MQEGAWMEGPVQVRGPLCIRRERRAPQKRREVPDWKREQPIEEKLSTDWRAWCPLASGGGASRGRWKSGLERRSRDRMGQEWGACNPTSLR